MQIDLLNPKNNTVEREKEQERTERFHIRGMLCLFLLLVPMFLAFRQEERVFV